MKSIVLDTNIIISALFWKGNQRQILNLVKAGKYETLTSIEIERELIRVLGYPKFGLTPAEILPIINDYRNYTKKVLVTSQINKVIEDPTDNIFLNCAVDGNADYIISGDHHLLNIGSYESIIIVTSEEFLKLEQNL